MEGKTKKIPVRKLFILSFFAIALTTGCKNEGRHPVDLSELNDVISKNSFLLLSNMRSVDEIMPLCNMSDSTRTSFKVSLSHSLLEISEDLDDKCLSIKNEFITKLGGNEKDHVDTLKLRDLAKGNETAFTKQYIEKEFPSQLNALKDCQRKINAVIPKGGVLKMRIDLDKYWSDKDITAQEFLFRLSTMKNEFLSMLNWIYNDQILK